MTDVCVSLMYVDVTGVCEGKRVVGDGSTREAGAVGDQQE